MMQGSKFFNLNNQKVFLVTVGSTVFLITAVVTAGIFSYFTSAASNEVAESQKKSLHLLQTHLSRLDRQVSDLNQQVSSLTERVKSNSASRDLAANRPVARDTGLVMAKSPEELARLKQMIQQTQSGQMRLKKIIASTGIEQLAGLEDMDPDFLREIYDSHTVRKTISAQREFLREQNRLLHLADKKVYDEHLDGLYQRARFRGRRGDSEESNKAFQEMLEKYPDAYATAMAIADRALYYTRRDVNEAEKYYTMLRDNRNENYANIITDRGVEARPNIEYNLMRRYIRDGRNEEATLLMESLQTNYADSLLRVRGRGRGGSWQTVSEALSQVSIGTN